MSSAKTPGASPSRGPLVIILAAIGVLAIIAGILYVSGAANSIHVMVGKIHHGHHQVRAIVSFVVGIAFLVGAYIARSRPAAGTARGGAPGAGIGGATATGPAPGPGPGTPGPGTPSPGTPSPGTPSPGTPSPGTPIPGTPSPGTPIPGTGTGAGSGTERGAGTGTGT